MGPTPGWDQPQDGTDPRMGPTPGWDRPQDRTNPRMGPTPGSDQPQDGTNSRMGPTPGPRWHLNVVFDHVINLNIKVVLLMKRVRICHQFEMTSFTYICMPCRVKSIY